MNDIHLAAFINPSHLSHSHASWRHPRTATDFTDPAFYERIAQVLERGKFDLLFLGDCLSVPTRFGGSIAETVGHGTQAAAMLDPTIVASNVAAVTKNLGLAATASTSYFSPYDLARRFSTLDHMSQGRIGWNVVTSVSQSDARNFGLDAQLAHDTRYDRADEFLEVAYKLWGSWGEDALILDQAAGKFANADLVHPIDHEGEWFKVKGPLSSPHSPQSRPVILQAGSSGRGREYAARWAEVVFAVNPSAAGRKSFYDDIKTRVSNYDRNPDGTKILMAFIPFVGETEEQARESYEFHNQFADPIDGLITLSNQLDHDFSAYSFDEPIADIKVEGVQGMFNLVQSLSKEQNLTLRDVGRLYAETQLIPTLIGTPTQIADQIEDLVRAGEADGIMLSAGTTPGTFEDFVDLVVPELQRRGVFRKEYKSSTLRGHLGLGPASLDPVAKPQA
ncbi:MAG: FMN-dependent monooxygenase [Gordonia sp.]|nr:FMN-dependent monooxygenase [Gordonia sp. (in: high G+C Gram-positive bacteria)]